MLLSQTFQIMSLRREFEDNMKKFTPLSVREVRWKCEREICVKYRTLTIVVVSGTRGDDRESEGADRIPAAALCHSSGGDRLQGLEVRLRATPTLSSARHPQPVHGTGR